MDAACREAHRRALADPHDRERRGEYARHLLRVGHRVAAMWELLAAAAPDSVESPRVEVSLPGDRHRRVVRFSPAAGLLDVSSRVAAPDVGDARWPGAMLVRPSDEDPVDEPVPLVLRPWPSCGVCERGAVTCERCHGRVGRSRRCRECDGDGVVACATCGGWDVVVPSYAPTDCGHLPGPAEWYGVGASPAGSDLSRAPELVRCARCGLAGVSREADDRVAWACGQCGHLRCFCG